MTLLFLAPYLFLIGLCGLSAFAAAVFALSSFSALMMGWALPTTALIRWSQVAQWAARNEPQLGHALLMLSGIGALSDWIAKLTAHSLDVDEFRAQRTLMWLGLPIAASAFVFSVSAMWAGLVRPGDFEAVAIGGLVPFNDPIGYFAGAYDVAKDGVWDYASTHRPIAAAFRSVLTFASGYSLSTMLILQSCLVAGAAWFATLAVARWRGIWAAIAFFALVTIYARTFLPTTFTEPLGLFWALLSIPFFIDALRSGNVKPALVAFAMTTVALMTRMGSMFTIPALALWLVWQFGDGRIAKLRILAASAGVLACVLVLNGLLYNLYGDTHGTVGGNFAYTVCGLTMGTDWKGCIIKLTGFGIPASETPELFNRIYTMAWENFKAHPNILFESLLAAMGGFSRNFQEVLWAGYTLIDMPTWLWPQPLAVLSLLGIAFIALFKADRIEITFWALLAASLYLSAAVVYSDDGARTMAVSQPLIALFFAMGLGCIVPYKPPSFSRSWRVGASGLILASMLFIMTPWVAYRVSGARAGDPVYKDGEAIVAGGRKLSGFLVVADSEPLRSDVASLHISDFEAIIRQSGIEDYQGLLHPVAPSLPFGFVVAPRLEKGVGSGSLSIVPASVLERGNVSAWRFRVDWRNQKPPYGPYWMTVTHAEPWNPDREPSSHLSETDNK